jgi:hypothetical protein
MCTILKFVFKDNDMGPNCQEKYACVALNN